MKNLCEYCIHNSTWCDGNPTIIIEEFLGLPGDDITVLCDNFSLKELDNENEKETIS